VRYRLTVVFDVPGTLGGDLAGNEVVQHVEHQDSISHG
jgi:hypothetical protein